MLRALFFVLLVACGTSPPAPSVEPMPDPRDAVSDPAEYHIEHASRDAGEAIFARTGIGDPYRTGIPYAIFLALFADYPELFGADSAAFAVRFGFIPRARDRSSDDLDAREGLPVGMHLTEDPNTRVHFLVSNCTLCHAERVRWDGGEAFVVGLGNRRVRVHAYDAALCDVAARPDFDADRLGRAAREVARERDLRWPAEWAGAIVSNTVAAFRERAAIRSELVARTREGAPGRVAPIESFAVALAHTLGRPIALPSEIGWAKVPDVVGFSARRSLSFDGGTEGSMDALVVEADFALGARPEWFWSHPFQGPSLSAYLREPRPRVEFPGAIDRALAATGRTEFEASCAPCHGTYAGDGRVLRYEERIVPLAAIGTDGARVHAVTEAFVEAANEPSLTHGIVRTRASGGYVPPVLTAVWLRAPYGHAGQWPSLAVLATPPNERPARFAIDLDGEMDLETVGRAIRDPGSGELRPGEMLYDGSANGFDVGGHAFLSALGPERARAVIEYLKTL